MSETLQSKLKSISEEISKLEDEKNDVTKLVHDLYSSGQSVPTPTQVRMEEAYRNLDDARQRQLSLLLTSISESSANMEGVTKNLQRSSESQLEVAQDQSRAVDALLGSSHRLEQFTIFVLIISAINIFIIEDTNHLLNGPFGYATIVAFVVAILYLTWIAYRWPRIIRSATKLAQNRRINFDASSPDTPSVGKTVVWHMNLSCYPTPGAKIN